MNPKHVLLTGATGGVGRALALALAAPGVTLSIQGRDEERLAEVSRECRERGAAVSRSVLDIRDVQALHHWVLRGDDALPVDLVIANAGVSSSVQADRGEHLEDVRRVFAVNTMGVVETVTPLAERMRKRGSGQIAVIGSLAGLLGLPSSPSYSASKGAVRLYGLALRARLRPLGVKVNVVTMGYVDSPMSRRYQGNQPLRCTAEQAAQRILRGLRRDKAEIVFPWLLVFGIRCLEVLPHDLGARILRRFFSFRVEPDPDSPLGSGQNQP